jgi:hypothetical protein
LNFFCGHPRWEATWNDGIIPTFQLGEAPNLAISVLIAFKVFDKPIWK